MLKTEHKMRVLTQHTVHRMTLLALEPPYDLKWVSAHEKPLGGGWQFRRETGRNEILLNEALDRYADIREELEGFALNVYFHEIAHSLYTDPDVKKAVKLMWRFGEKVPFSTLNMCEDARIEACWRSHTGRTFQWERWLLLPWQRKGATGIEKATPEEIFMAFVTREGEEKAIAEILEEAGKDSPACRARAERVLWYYRRAIDLRAGSAGETLALVPLCRAWHREFGSSAKGRRWLMKLGSFHGDDVRQFIEENMPDDEDFLDASFREEDLLACDDPCSLRALRMRRIALSRRGRPNGSKLWIPDCNRGKFNPARASAVEDRLARWLRGGEERRVKTVFPNKIFSARDYARGSKRVYRGRRRTSEGVKKVLLLVDCSGSMKGTPALNGLTLLQVINRLHRKGEVDARVFLTYGPNEELPLPFEEERLFSLASKGGTEGFERCIRENEEAVRGADVVFAYTDGQITDDPIDRERWRRLGTPSFGLYAGDGHEEYARKLEKWFEHGIAAPSLERMIDAFVKELRRT